MRVLALELSSGQGSIAFLDGDETCYLSEFANNRKHSGPFFDSLKLCLEEFRQPDRIVVGLGPGSYAGTRIAIATAIGLQSATGAELVGLPSFCALPTSFDDYVVIGDARRQSFWLARVSRRICADGPSLYTEEQLKTKLEAIESAVFTSETLSSFLHVTLLHPSALILAQTASVESAVVRPTPLEPIYLREPHITRPKAA